MVDSTFSLQPTNNGEYPWLGSAVAAPGKWRRQGKRGLQATSLVRLRKCENRPPLRVFFWLMFSHWIISWMNSGAGWLFNRIPRTLTLWFSRRLGFGFQGDFDPGLGHCSWGGLHSQPGQNYRIREEQGRKCLLHGQQLVVLTCGDYFYGLFSGPRAPHDQMPALLSLNWLNWLFSQQFTFHHTPTPTKPWMSCMVLSLGQRPHGRRLVLLHLEFLMPT